MERRRRTTGQPFDINDAFRKVEITERDGTVRETICWTDGNQPIECALRAAHQGDLGMALRAREMAASQRRFLRGLVASLDRAIDEAASAAEVA